MARERDQLSIAYDGATRRALVAAIRSRPRARTVWVESPGREYRDTDPGGRTKHERAFTRSAYYHVVQVPRRQGVRQEWSLKLTWGKIERRGSRYGRPVTLRLYRAGSGYAYARKAPGSRGLQPTGTGY